MTPIFSALTLVPEVWGECPSSSPPASLSLIPSTPVGMLFCCSAEVNSPSASSFRVKARSLIGSSFTLRGLESSRAFSGLTNLSYSSESSLLTYTPKIEKFNKRIMHKTSTSNNIQPTGHYISSFHLCMSWSLFIQDAVLFSALRPAIP